LKSGAWHGILPQVEIRTAQPSDLEHLGDIDGTVDSAHYLHLERSGDGLDISFAFQARPLRQRLIQGNVLDDDMRFAIKQVVMGIEEGVAVVAEHEDNLIAMAAAQVQAAGRTLELLDLRVDFDFRRQGIGSALLFQLIADAKQRKLRAVTARDKASNHPAHQFLAKAGFDLAGLDTHFTSNHDLVKEQVTLFWYATLE
jgi:N-acetylglutamate synthase-like GNAT family acetyltransferase